MRIDARHPWVFFIGIALVTGCSARVGPKDGAVEQARRVAELEREVDRLTIEVEEARADLEMVDATQSTPEVMASLPKPTGLATASGSAVRRNADATVLRWRIRPEDVRGRFLQVTGPVVVEAVTLGDRGGAVELGRWEIDPVQWRESLREGFMGSAYAVDIPLETSLPARAKTILARISVSDVRLDSPLTLESDIPIVNGSRKETSTP